MFIFTPPAPGPFTLGGWGIDDPIGPGPPNPPGPPLTPPGPPTGPGPPKGGPPGGPFIPPYPGPPEPPNPPGPAPGPAAATPPGKPGRAAPGAPAFLGPGSSVDNSTRRARPLICTSFRFRTADSAVSWSIWLDVSDSGVRTRHRKVMPACGLTEIMAESKSFWSSRPRIKFQSISYSRVSSQDDSRCTISSASGLQHPR
jgi:hypothetical protein